jgi:activator of 2-hydroxyglutaryl-CoA dehydratase
VPEVPDLSRLHAQKIKYDSLDDFIQTGLSVKDPASISGRCAVFAESDIVHHYQKGTSRDRIVAGIHQAVARSYKNLIRKGTVPTKKIAFVGGVAKTTVCSGILSVNLNLIMIRSWFPKKLSISELSVQLSGLKHP